jgi:hypothetical protein
MRLEIRAFFFFLIMIDLSLDIMTCMVKEVFAFFGIGKSDIFHCIIYLTH